MFTKYFGPPQSFSSVISSLLLGYFGLLIPPMLALALLILNPKTIRRVFVFMCSALALMYVLSYLKCCLYW